MEYPRFLYALIAALLITSFACNKGSGPVAPSDPAEPRACFTNDSPAGAVRGEYVVFDASCSTGGLFAIKSYTWDWGDGSEPLVTTAPEAIHRFLETGMVDVTLTVANSAGLTSEEASEVQVVPTGAPPEPLFTIEAPDGWQPGSSLIFNASGTTDPDGDDFEFTWDWGDGQTYGPTPYPIVSHRFDIEGEIEVTLTVTDEAGWEVVSEPERLSFGYPTGCPLVTTLDFDGVSATDIVMQGQYAYVSTSYPGMLHVVDISNPASLFEVGSLTTEDDSIYFDVSGNYGVIRSGSQWLQIVDVSDTTNPTIVKEIHRDLTIHDAVISGGYIYVSEETIGVRVISLEKLWNPQVVATIDSPATEWEGYPYSNMQIEGNRLMVARSRYFELYDISNPEAPVTIVQTQMEPGCYYHLQTYGDYLFASRCRGELSIFDISNPLAMVEIGSTPANCGINMAPGDGKLILAENGLEILDISDPATPELIGTGAIPSQDTDSYFQGAYSVAVRDNYAFVAARLTGLSVFDINSPKGPRCTGSVDYPPGGASIQYDIEVHGDRAYVTPIDGGLGILDISDPLNPVMPGHIFVPSSMLKFDVVGNYLYYLDDYQGLVVCDVSNPAVPRIAVSIAFGDYPIMEDFVISGDIIYLTGRRYFATIDIHDPENPELLLVKLTNFYSYHITEHAGYVYIPGYYEPDTPDILLVMNVANPKFPVVVTDIFPETFESHWPAVLETSGEYLYILSGRQGTNSILDVLDISNPAFPVPISSKYMRGQQATMRVAGRYAYVADTSNDLSIVDLIDPNNLEVVGYAGVRASLRYLDVYGNYAFGLSEGVGLSGEDDQVIFSTIELWQ